jgi:hypothetical protein
MQTMLVGYSSLIDRLGGPEAVVLLTQLQEVNEHACDVGSVRSRSRFPSTYLYAG